MFRRFSVNFAILSMVLDMGLTLLALALAFQLRPMLPQLPFSSTYLRIQLPSILYLVVPLLWGTTFLLASVYDPRRIYKVVDEFQMVMLSIGVASLIYASLLYLTFRGMSRWLFIIFVLLDVAFLLGWRILARLSFKIGRPPDTERRVLIVGAGEVGRRVGQMIQEQPLTGLVLSGYLDDDERKHGNGLPVLGRLEDVHRVVQRERVDDVVVALPQQAYGQVNKLVLTLHKLPVEVRVVPDYFSLALYRAQADDFGGLPMINLRDPALNDVQRLAKRLFDLVVTSICIILASPFMGLIALLIKLDSRGPMIFRQKRVGENGQVFDMFKFRTMVNGAERLQDQVNHINGNGELIHKQPDDPRVTSIGRFLRRTSLDELPQLFNVLKGDMSLVGPRPELPWLVGQYEPWQRKRFAVPQGMTGWWQVNGRSDRPMHLHTEDDLYYVQNYSLWMDIFILLKTPWVVMRGKGAY